MNMTVQAFYFEVLAQQYVYYGNNSSTIGDFEKVKLKAKEIFATAHVHTCRKEVIAPVDFEKHNFLTGTPKQLRK